MKLCPFCGGKGLADSVPIQGARKGDPEGMAHFVRCRSCAAQGGWAKNAAGAVRLWNMREVDRVRGEGRQDRAHAKS